MGVHVNDPVILKVILRLERRLTVTTLSNEVVPFE